MSAHPLVNPSRVYWLDVSRDIHRAWDGMSAEEVGALMRYICSRWNVGRLPNARHPHVAAVLPYLRFKSRQNLRPTLAPGLRAAVVARDGLLCRYCGGPAVPLHIDHVVPVSRGGATTLRNLVVACRKCNLAKGAKLVTEWVR